MPLHSDSAVYSHVMCLTMYLERCSIVGAAILQDGVLPKPYQVYG